MKPRFVGTVHPFRGTISLTPPIGPPDKHKLLVIKNQLNLFPDKPLELCIRFDPGSSGGHGHGGAKEVLYARFPIPRGWPALYVSLSFPLRERKIKGKQPITGGTPSLPEVSLRRFPFARCLR